MQVEALAMVALSKLELAYIRIGSGLGLEFRVLGFRVWCLGFKG